MPVTTAVITAAARTPIGRLQGALSACSAAELGHIVLQEAMQRAALDPKEVGQVVMGQVLTGGAGQNPARLAALRAGLPETCPAWLVNQVCGSGLRAVVEAAQSILTGDCRIALAGGQESMSQAPHAVFARSGLKLGDGTLVDTVISDGLWCAVIDQHMGITAENIAKKDGITRAMQDAFAAESQQKAEAAIKDSRFQEEIVPVPVKNRKTGTEMIAKDEHPRPGTTADSLASLPPAFLKNGTVTAGNASGINDGAAALVLMEEKEAERRGAEILGRIVSWASSGIAPSVMGWGPVPASQEALRRAGWTSKDLDLIESNEAFAAQSLSVIKALALEPKRVNPNGGAIALGHPIGASGARILTTLLYEMGRREAKRGLATLCIGGGMGIALCVERP